MTDNEIIKALEYWREFDKEIDVLLKIYPEEKADLLEQREIVKITVDALDLIDRQKAENKELQDLMVKYNADLVKQETEIERLKNHIQEGIDLAKQLPEMVALIKAEAYKEFAERLKERTKGCYYLSATNDIDNLLKEMVGAEHAD